MTSLSTLSGSAVPAITVDFVDDSFNPRQVTGIRAQVYNQFNTLVTTVTFGDFSPASPADTYTSTIEEKVLDGKFVYELINLPISSGDLFPDGKVTILWSAIDGATTLEDQWKFYQASFDYVDDPKKVVITWADVPGADQYKVTASNGDVLGFTSFPFLVADAPDPTPTEILLPGTDGNSLWRMYIEDDLGTIATEEISETLVSGTPTVYINSTDGISVYSIAVQPDGAIETTYSAGIDVQDDLILPGIPGDYWKVEVGELAQLITTEQAGSLVADKACDLSYTVTATCCTGTGNDVYSQIGVLSSDSVEVFFTDQDICIVTGMIKDVVSRGGTNQKVHFYVHHHDKAQVVQNAFFHKYGEYAAAINNTGRFAAPLVQGAYLTVEIPTAGTHKFVVPAKAQADISNISLLPFELYRGE